MKLMTKLRVPVLMMMLFQVGHEELINAISFKDLSAGATLIAQGQPLKAFDKWMEIDPSSIHCDDPEKYSGDDKLRIEVVRYVKERKIANPGIRLSCEELFNDAKASMNENVRAARRAEVQSLMSDLKDLGGDSAILMKYADGIRDWREKQEYDALLGRARAEIERLRKEYEIRRQQEEARARQEAERQRLEEEARARREAELLKQQEEARAQQKAEVQRRMRELESVGGNPAILNKFTNGTRSPEEIVQYRAALNRADAEITRLKREAELNAQYEKE
jgi:hypothetical protein